MGNLLPHGTSGWTAKKEPKKGEHQKGRLCVVNAFHQIIWRQENWPDSKKVGSATYMPPLSKRKPKAEVTAGAKRERQSQPVATGLEEKGGSNAEAESDEDASESDDGAETEPKLRSEEEAAGPSKRIKR